VERRRFLASSLGASALAYNASSRVAQAAGFNGREFYELRRYHLTMGPQRKLAESYLREALVPALNRLGIRPVGVFSSVIGPESATLLLLIASVSAEMLVTTPLRLQDDAEYRKAGADFLGAPARQPPFVRVESSLMVAFAGKPKLTVPPVTAAQGARVFELRTYESPSDRDHVRKVEMFHSGEFNIFQRAGFWEIFYGDTLVGPRLPNLTYMLGFPDLSEREKKWKAFFSDPEWKKLTASPRFSFESIVSNVTNTILSPAAYSQI